MRASSGAIAALVALLATAGMNQARELRSVIGSPSVVLPNVSPTGADQDIILSYEDETALEYFLTLPNEYEDATYNVRFSPTLDSAFYLKGALIPLFNMFGNPGTPDMRVSVWQSGEVNGISGMPAEFIDDLVVESGNLVFSGRDTITKNYIDLTPLRISFNDSIDFHIGVDLINAEAGDTLAIYVDNANRNPTDRSIFWNGQDSAWSKWMDVNSENNFAIRAVVTDVRPYSVPSAEGGGAAPATAALMPAFPNPFNSSVSIPFTVPYGREYRLSVYDVNGRFIGDLRGGRGEGRALATFTPANLPVGVYNVRLQLEGSAATQRIVLLK